MWVAAIPLYRLVITALEGCESLLVKFYIWCSQNGKNRINRPVHLHRCCHVRRFTSCHLISQNAYCLWL